MQNIQEDNFPRGSKPVTESDKPRQKVHRQENLFGVIRRNEPKKKKSKRQRAETRKIKLEEEIVLPLVEPHVLTYKTIKTHMIILGNIRSVSIVAAEVELPGRIYGFLNMGEISDMLTDKIRTQLNVTNKEEAQDLVLSNFFEVGQFVPVKVLNLEPTERGIKVDLSTKPSVINADLSHSAFRKQMLVWATVIEKLDHGYRLDVGVQNVRVFLQNAKVPEGIHYRIGQNLWCVVHSCDIAPTAATLKVSALQKHVDCAVENGEDRSLHSVLPGMQFNFDIVTLTKNGLLGEFLYEHKAYVHDMYLQKPVQDVKAFKEGQEIKGRVLYIEPITKFVFLTLRGIGTVPKYELNIGEIISAKVLGRSSGGIYLQLNETEKGFVTFRRILNSLGKETLEDVTDLVKEKYPKGKAVKCRILDYNRLDAVYMCAVEASVLNEKFFTKDDLALGQLVTAHVTDIKNAGLVVKFGHLQGFIDNVHLSNVQYSENIKSKFCVNKKVKARVLRIINNSIRLTAKPALVESDICLASPEQAEIGKQFPGVVVRRSKFGALVAFYGNVKGFVHASKLLPGESADATELLFDGQVVNATITGENAKGIELSLIAVKEEDNEISQKLLMQVEEEKREKQPKKGKLKIGQVVTGAITKIHKEGLHVKVDGKNVEAFLPYNHLSVNYDLNPLLLQTYAVNDRLENLLCIATGKNIPLVSLREGIAHKELKLSVPKKLEPGLLVRGSFITRDDGSITIHVPTKTGSHTVHMSAADLFPKTNTLESTVFVEQQAIVAKVISVGRKITLSSKEEDVCGCTVKHALYLLEQYILDTHKIYLHLRKIRDPLSKFSLGQRVTCLVETIRKCGTCQLLLKGGVKGFVPVVHSLADIEPGCRVEGVVLWIDYVDRVVYISLQPDVIDRISEKQDGIIDESFVCPCEAGITLITKNFAVCTSDRNKQLVFIPFKLHENYSPPPVDTYTSWLGRPMRVLLYKNVAGRLLGFEGNYEGYISNLHSSLTEALLEKEENHRKKQKVWKSVQEPEIDENFISDTETTQNTSDDDEEEVVNDVISIGTKRKLETESTEQQKKKNKKEMKDISFPSMASFFEVDDEGNNNNKGNESSDDDTADLERPRKRKKLTASEHAELSRKEEERLRQIENELADPNKTPETAEQFERLALANPNSSKIWTQYIAFHLSTAEVEKARIVVKRALETIQMEKIQDKLNIWVAHLNLENMFGTKDSFEKVFEEATKCNEPYDIYLETIKIFAQTKKFEAMEDKMKKFRGKFKDIPKTWIEIGKVYYELEKFDEARKLKERALKSITDKKQHINMLVQFAIMEFKCGEQNQGEVLFETILSSYPGRVDVWNSYVDQLVKKGCIDSARRVLERATSQRLNLVKMRSLFKKFRDFEKAHGTEETLQQVKDALTEYVASVKGSVDK